MSKNRFRAGLAVGLAVLALGATACKTGDGDPGTPGAPGAPGDPGAPGGGMGGGLGAPGGVVQIPQK